MIGRPIFVLLRLVLISYCTAAPPNIIIILADDLGWNDVSFHGSQQIRTPNLDRLAHEGVILNNYYVSPICTPTRGSLMTGRHPMQLGLQRRVPEGPAPWGLGVHETIIPQCLKQAGYVSHIIAWAHEDSIGLDFRNGMDLVSSAIGLYSTELFTSRAQTLIANHDPRKPLFLYLPYQAVHSGNPTSAGYNPLEAPKKYIDRFPHIADPNRRTFAGMVSALDNAVGNLTSSLEAKGMMNNTVIIFSTDNGGPANGFDMNHASNWPLRGMKSTYWEGGVRATGFIWSRLLENKARVSNALMHVADWFPTILHIAGLDDVVKKKDFYGMNMWRALSAGLPSPRKQLIHNYDRGSGAIRRGRYKLMVISWNDTYNTKYSGWYKPEGDKVTMWNFTVKCTNRDSSLPGCTAHTSPCLFDVITDPCEYNNIANKHPGIVSAMMDAIIKFASSSQTPRNCPRQKWASPIYHGYAWVPWIRLDSDKHDDRQCDPV